MCCDLASLGHNTPSIFTRRDDAFACHETGDWCIHFRLHKGFALNNPPGSIRPWTWTNFQFDRPTYSVGLSKPPVWSANFQLDRVRGAPPPCTPRVLLLRCLCKMVLKKFHSSGKLFSSKWMYFRGEVCSFNKIWLTRYNVTKNGKKSGKIERKIT